MSPALNSTNGTTPATTTWTAEGAANSSDPANISCSEPETATPCLFGESSSTIADSKASTAPCSETKPRTATAVQSLSDRLTPLLIARGLVRGTTHTSIRKQSGAPIRASALWPLDGGDVEKPKVDCSSSNESFVEETCKCGRVWRGKPGSNPAAACPDCGADMAAEHKWRRENHHP